MKAMIFDLDDTLYDQVQPFRRAVQEHLKVAEEDLVPLYLSFRKYADAVFEETVSGQMDLIASHIYRMQEAFKDLGITITEELALAIQHRYSYYQGHLDLEEAWKELFAVCQQKGILLGIITNGPHLHQLKKIQALKLEQWIDKDKMIISGQVGMTKPNPAIFQLMEKRVACPAEDICYVGDSFDNDVVGSKQAGWWSIWYNHRGRQNRQKGMKADWEVTSIQEILAILEEMKQ